MAVSRLWSDERLSGRMSALGRRVSALAMRADRVSEVRGDGLNGMRAGSPHHNLPGWIAG
jgi:hypothetical protein